MGTDTPTDEVLGELFAAIESYRADLPKDSYVTTPSAHEKGENYVLEKLDEETIKAILAAKDDDGEELFYESANLICHLLVLLPMKDISLGDPCDELKACF